MSPTAAVEANGPLPAFGQPGSKLPEAERTYILSEPMTISRRPSPFTSAIVGEADIGAPVLKVHSRGALACGASAPAESRPT
jgi:hypothetical protein